jgi:dGTPase
MEWSKLLKLERLNDAGYILQKHRPAYAQDIDRILFSPPFRRLGSVGIQRELMMAAAR